MSVHVPTSRICEFGPAIGVLHQSERVPARVMQRLSCIRALLAVLALLAMPVRGAEPVTTRPGDVVADAMSLALPGTVRMQGWLGDKLVLCLNDRVWTQDPERLVAVLRHHNDKDNWRGEYWGKWYSAAVLGYGCEPMAERRAQLENVMREVIQLQQLALQRHAWRDDSRRRVVFLFYTTHGRASAEFHSTPGSEPELLRGERATGPIADSALGGDDIASGPGGQPLRAGKRLT